MSSVTHRLRMWFQSGRRRDLCAILYDAGELRGQKFKTRLEAHYDTRIDPKSFYGTLDALVSKGHLTRRTEGLHDVYALTERGEKSVESYYDWLSERVAAEEASDEGATNDADDADERGATDEAERPTE